MASCEPLKVPSASIPNLKSLPGTGDGQSFSPAITMSTRTGADSQVEAPLTKKKAIDLTVSDFTFSSPEHLPLPQVVHKSFGHGIAVKFAFSFVAATCAELVTYPLDLTKTRLQLQGEVAVNQFNHIGEVRKRGMIRTAQGIVTEEGFFKLWQGMTPALYRHLIYSGTRMNFYEFLRDSMKNEDGSLPLWKAVIGGVFAGGFAQFLASPADLVKVRVQAEGRRRLLNLPPRVKNSWHAFTQIVHEGGVLSLWRGWGPNVQRAALVNLGDLTTYDTAKRVILKHTGLRDNTFTHALSSMFSGLIAASLGTPADVIKTRIMNQPTDEKGRGLVYKGSVDCFIQAVRKEGFFSLYKGFIPCWLRMGPWSLTFWMTYEKLRKLGGVKSF